MPDPDLVVTGNIVLDDRILIDGFIAIRNGLIEQVGEGSAPMAKTTENYSGGYVLPGAIDGQVHSLSQHGQEGFEWSSRSAAAGGVTTIVDMPYDDGHLICTGERLRAKAERASERSRVDFALYGTVRPKDGPMFIEEMVNAGAAAFKFSTFATDEVRFPRIPPQTLYECFSEIARFDLIAGVHNENDEVIRFYLDDVRNSGQTDYLSHGLSRPAISELLATAEVYEIGAATGCPAHIVHCSLPRGYEMAASYRKQEYSATIEACIHYLMLCEEEDVCRLGGIAKVNPPIRSKADRENIWRHLEAGNVTIVSTDHVSWSLDRKNQNNMLDNASGVPGLEVLVPLLATGLKERDLSLTWVARLLASNPAKLFRIDHRKGSFQPGLDADITILVEDRHEYNPSASGNNVVDWSPYSGRELEYRTEATYLRGKLVGRQGVVLAEPGEGQWIKPDLNRIQA